MGIDCVVEAASKGKITCNLIVQNFLFKIVVIILKKTSLVIPATNICKFY